MCELRCGSIQQRSFLISSFFLLLILHGSSSSPSCLVICNLMSHMLPSLTVAPYSLTCHSLPPSLTGLKRRTALASVTTTCIAGRLSSLRDLTVSQRMNSGLIYDKLSQPVWCFVSFFLLTEGNWKFGLKDLAISSGKTGISTKYPLEGWQCSNSLLKLNTLHRLVSTNCRQRLLPRQQLRHSQRVPSGQTGQLVVYLRCCEVLMCS